MSSAEDIIDVISSCSEAGSEEDNLPEEVVVPPTCNENTAPGVDGAAASGMLAPASSDAGNIEEVAATHLDSVALLETVFSASAPAVPRHISMATPATATLQPEQRALHRLGSTRSYGATLQLSASLRGTQPLLPAVSGARAPTGQPVSFSPDAPSDAIGRVASAATPRSRRMERAASGRGNVDTHTTLASQPSADAKLRQTYAQSMLKDACSMAKEATAAATLQHMELDSPVAGDHHATILARCASQQSKSSIELEDTCARRYCAMLQCPPCTPHSLQATDMPAWQHVHVSLSSSCWTAGTSLACPVLDAPLVTTSHHRAATPRRRVALWCSPSTSHAATTTPMPHPTCPALEPPCSLVMPARPTALPAQPLRTRHSAAPQRGAARPSAGPAASRAALSLSSARATSATRCCERAGAPYLAQALCGRSA